MENINQKIGKKPQSFDNQQFNQEEGDNIE